MSLSLGFPSAGATLSGPLEELRQRLLAGATHPQQEGLINVHMQSIASGMAGLASMGHRFRIEADEHPPMLEYPKVLLAGGEAGGESREVHSSAEETEARKDGFAMQGEAAATPADAAAASASTQV